MNCQTKYCHSHDGYTINAEFRMDEEIQQQLDNMCSIFQDNAGHLI